jgi:hypothetical protein
MKTFKGLQVGQLGRNALESVVFHLQRATRVRQNDCGAQETYPQRAQRSQEAYLSRQTNEAIVRELESSAS